MLQNKFFKSMTYVKSIYVFLTILLITLMLYYAWGPIWLQNNPWLKAIFDLALLPALFLVNFLANYAAMLRRAIKQGNIDSSNRSESSEKTEAGKAGSKAPDEAYHEKIVSSALKKAGPTVPVMGPAVTETMASLDSDKDNQSPPVVPGTYVPGSGSIGDYSKIEQRLNALEGRLNEIIQLFSKLKSS